ncbi:MAG: MaoC/PaaZ C-terminal domain-containing protein [Chloroflexota bacterium]
MAKQLYWEDVKEGSEVTPLSKIATTLMLVRWAGGSGDFNPLHYDHSFAAKQGVGKPIVHGALKRQWLVQLVTDWIGDEGTLKKFSCQYRAIDWPRQMKTQPDPEEGETWLVKGKVTKKYQEGNEHLVDCEIWVQNGKSEITTPGKATVALPSRS